MEAIAKVGRRDSSMHLPDPHNYCLRA